MKFNDRAKQSSPGNNDAASMFIEYKSRIASRYHSFDKLIFTIADEASRFQTALSNSCESINFAFLE